MEKLPLALTPFTHDLLEDIRKVQSILVGHGARKIILYGSLARGDYTDGSDIDICVEGLPAGNYFRALADCITQIQRRVSIIDFDDTYGYFKARILREGKILYEHE
jgi:predicted nucleotidyltransferase